ncbi:MAG TPA: hypothetical protein EYQ53_05935 [Candidatus Poseidoniales archaeon]|jgi:hypothetical protein|nr:hypothetical protein [Candidatus Poseidoniales archaeon]HIK78778.1 hypothetical protein [Candidatus Poseidoniales archaeon]
MKDENNPGEESRLDSSKLPKAVQRLADAMLGIDPAWQLKDWLQNKAEEDLKLLSADLQRETLQAEQRLHRIESLSRRLDVDVKGGDVDLGQKNLFDCFDIIQRGLNISSDSTPDSPYSSNECEEFHPAGMLTNLLPSGETDDPFLAITAQHVLLQIGRLMEENVGVAPAEEIFNHLNERQIEDEEINEAINFLLLQGSIIEIDEDIFILGDE